MPKSVACSGIVIPFELHCCPSHPSLCLWKKLYPQFSNLSLLNCESCFLSIKKKLLNCESCQYAKLHRVHLSPRVNKRASAPFELVHSDVWGSYPVMSPTGFKYFITFVDDFSRVTWLYLI